MSCAAFPSAPSTARREREGSFHDYWRRRYGQFPMLRTPETTEPVLDAWRDSITRHGASPVEVVDTTRLDLGDALARLQAEGHGGYV